MERVKTVQEIIKQSDKFFWHGYVDFYERFFRTREIEKIAEIGVSLRFSIKWLLDRFPQAEIHGADIVDRLDCWPKDERFKFTQMDQGNIEQLKSYFGSKDFDLIIEDGSHMPEHQKLALIHGVPAVKSGGLYILEDVHTSHPARIRKARRHFRKLLTPKGNCLSVLLGIDHYKGIEVEVDEKRAELLAKDSIFEAQEIYDLAKEIDRIHFYRRTRLPERCIRCGSVDYNFSTYRCQCGLRVFSDSDSMTFVIEKK
jgi:hypothetical protein